MTSAETASSPFMAQILRRPIAALFLICIALWLPVFASLPAIDRDESRFAQSSKQMLETGNFVDIQQGYVKRYKKPVGIYWLQAAATAVVDTVDSGVGRSAIWTYRIPSFLGAFAAVALTFWTARAFATAEAAFLGALLLGLSLLLTAESSMAKTDAVLLATIVACMGVLVRLYLANPDAGRSPPPLWMILAGWAALGIGLLVKAPVNLLVIGLGVLAFSLWDRDGTWLLKTRPLLGIPLALLIFLPWLIAIAFISHGQFFEGSLGKDLGAKVVGGEETHGALPGYYVVMSSVTFWPGTLVLLPAVLFGIRHRSEPHIRFLLAWAGAAWLMFELVPTKLLHYVLPTYPALAILGGLWLTQPLSPDRLARGLAIGAAVLFAIVGIAAAGALLYAPLHFGVQPPAWLYGVSVVLALIVLGGAVLSIMGRRLAALGAAVAAALMFSSAASFAALPRLGHLWTTESAASVIARHTKRGDPPIIAVGYEEASLSFRLGTFTHLGDDLPGSVGREADIAATQGGLALVEDEKRAEFLSELNDAGGDAKPVDRFSGYNYSRGREVHITVYRITPAFQETTPPPE